MIGASLSRFHRWQCRRSGHRYLYTESLGVEWCVRCGERETVGPTTVTVIIPDGWPETR